MRSSTMRRAGDSTAAVMRVRSAADVHARSIIELVNALQVLPRPVSASEADHQKYLGEVDSFATEIIDATNRLAEVVQAFAGRGLS